ncbi:hypothetical protein D3C81_1683490 [compost metagenome]
MVGLQPAASDGEQFAGIEQVQFFVRRVGQSRQSFGEVCRQRGRAAFLQEALPFAAAQAGDLGARADRQGDALEQGG